MASCSTSCFRAASPAHPLAHRRAIDPELIREEHFILREPGSGTRLAAIDFFDQRKIDLKLRMELDRSEAIKQCVMAGLGIAVLSLNNLKQEIAGNRIKILDVKGFALKRSRHVVHLRDKALTPVAKAFWEFTLHEDLKRRPSLP